MGAFPDTLTSLAMLDDWQAAGRPQPVEVAPGTVTITRPAYLVAQFREATATTDRLHRQAREFSDADEQAYDAAERTASDARAALRAMVAAWGVEPDQFAEALS